MIDTDKYEGLIDAEGYIDYDGLDHLLAEVERLRWALAYTASLLTCRIEGDDIPVTDIREYALDVVDMTVDEAMATTDLMEESE
jgi:hypothetical protein